MMFNHPDITVVIPLYNKEKYVERAVRSVLRQSHQGFELIIVNDGSTDQSLQVVERFSDYRIRIISQDNQGVSAARNKGIQEAASDLIAFLDADDEYLPKMLETLLRLRRNYPEAGAYTTAYLNSENGQLRTRSVIGIPIPPWEGIMPNYFYSRLNSIDAPNNSSSTAICRHIFDEVGYFPVGESHGEDVDMFCRVAMRYPYALSTEECSICYRDIENSASKQWHVSVAYITTIKQAAEEGRIPQYMREDALEFAHIIEINCALGHIMQGDIRTARKMLLTNKTKRFRRDKWHVFLMSFEHIKTINLILHGIRFIRDSIKKIIGFQSREVR